MNTLLALSLLGASAPTILSGSGMQAAGPSYIDLGGKSGAAGHVLLPATSLGRSSDLGLRAHTNHLMWRNDGFMPMANSPQGLVPKQLYKAYGLPTSGGSGAVPGAIAIVDAYHYPTALNDFNVFATQFGLPKELGSKAVFEVKFASGVQPPSDGGWSQEMALDIEWAHAMDPRAKIYLVEAASAYFSDMIAAVNYAKVLPNVKEISMSWGGGEWSTAYTSYDSAFLQNGVTFFASGGDTGGQRLFPALSANVVAVGGTSLYVDANGNRTSPERAWSGTGCGPSAYEPRPAFQNIVQAIVGTHRGGDDISAIADPYTGVSVYDSFAYGGYSGWLVFGGTSVACPLIAGMTNASDRKRASSQALNTRFYAGLSSAAFNDITAGSAGGFAAVSGWDFPTGVGTPRTLAGF